MAYRITEWVVGGLAALALFVIAGFIEGTVSQIHPPKLSVAFKVSFALAVGVGVYAYLCSDFLRAHREERSASHAG